MEKEGKKTSKCPECEKRFPMTKSNRKFCTEFCQLKYWHDRHVRIWLHKEALNEISNSISIDIVNTLFKDVVTESNKEIIRESIKTIVYSRLTPNKA